MERGSDGVVCSSMAGEAVDVGWAQVGAGVGLAFGGGVMWVDAGAGVAVGGVGVWVDAVAGAAGGGGEGVRSLSALRVPSNGCHPSRNITALVGKLFLQASPKLAITIPRLQEQNLPSQSPKGQAK